jgi:hypothetical protein
MEYNSSMKFLALLFALFGGFIVYYSMTPLPHEIAQQWMMIGGAFIFGGLFLYAYMGKKKK